MAASITVEFGYPTQVLALGYSLHMAETNSGLANPQSEATRRSSGAVIVPFPPASPGNSSKSSPGTTLTNKNANENHELGEMPEKNPDDGPYGV